MLTGLIAFFALILFGVLAYHFLCWLESTGEVHPRSSSPYNVTAPRKANSLPEAEIHPEGGGAVFTIGRPGEIEIVDMTRLRGRLADIRIAQLEANEKLLLHQIQRLTAERDSDAVEAAPERPPATIIKDLLRLTADDVLYESHHRVESLWKKEGRWLYHPADDTWQEGYQPVPLVPGTEFGVRVFA